MLGGGRSPAAGCGAGADDEAEEGGAIMKKSPAQKRLNSLILVNEDKKQYSVIDLGADWQIASLKPFDLMQQGYVFITKYQAGFCGEATDAPGAVIEVKKK